MPPIVVVGWDSSGHNAERSIIDTHTHTRHGHVQSILALRTSIGAGGFNTFRPEVTDATRFEGNSIGVSTPILSVFISYSVYSRPDAGIAHLQNVLYIRWACGGAEERLAPEQSHPCAFSSSLASLSGRFRNRVES